MCVHNSHIPADKCALTDADTITPIPIQQLPPSSISFGSGHCIHAMSGADFQATVPRLASRWGWEGGEGGEGGGRLLAGL